MNAERVLADLDRCEHGRHEGDQCFDCPDGTSAGNPHLRPGQTIGYGLDGVPIVMPGRSRKYNPTNWYQADAPAVPAPHPCIIQQDPDPGAHVEQYLVRCSCHMKSFVTWRPGDGTITCPESGAVIAHNDGSSPDGR